MAPRTLKARLTLRILALGGGMTVAVGIAAVVVTTRVLDASDTEMALGRAASARDDLARELAEGDTLAEAIREVAAAAEAQGGRLAVHAAGAWVREAADFTVPQLEPGHCRTVSDGAARPWRACAAGSPTTLVVAVPLSAHRAVVRQLARGMIAIVVFAVCALWLAVRRALQRPAAELTALVEWTNGVMETDHAVPPPPSQIHEIVQLEGAFDSVLRRLFEALARERANSAHLAHELRTPLTAMVAELDGLRADDNVIQSALMRLRGDATRLADVIDALLLLAGAPRDGGQRGEIVNVADLARDLAPMGVIVEAPDEALVLADERLVSLALRNLLDNARKYAGGATVIRISHGNARVRIAVSDRGPGLGAAARERMFDRYWRGSADGSGRGLGLSLVRAVAEHHGGSAQAQPVLDGNGLEVSLTLDRLVGWHERAAVAR